MDPHKRHTPAALALCAALLLGCGPEQFGLALQLVVPEGHDAAADLDHLLLEVRYADGRAWDLALDSPSPGDWVIPDLPAGEGLSLRFVGLVDDGAGAVVEVASGAAGPFDFSPEVEQPTRRVLFTRRGRTGRLPSALDSSRVDPMVAPLPDGGVLVAGGAAAGDDETALRDTAARFRLDGPDAARFIEVDSMAGPRADGVALPLPDGRVFVMGTTRLISARTGDIVVDYDADVLEEAQRVGVPEVFDPADGSWESLDDSVLDLTARGHHAAALAGDAVVVTGGILFDAVGGIGLSASQDTLVFPLDGDEASEVELMYESRWRHTLTDLGGRLVAVGGAAVPTTSNTYPEIERVEVFDVDEQRWELFEDLVPGRSDHVAAALPDGTLLVAGGVTALETEVLADAWILDLDADTITPAAPLGAPRVRASVTTLPDGRVVVCGGETTDFVPIGGCEVYAPGPGGGAWAPAPDPSAAYVPAFGAATARLGSGEVLVVGGMDEAQGAVDDVIVYRP